MRINWFIRLEKWKNVIASMVSIRLWPGELTDSSKWVEIIQTKHFKLISLCLRCFVCSLAADIVLFNSKFNQDSFLENINAFINIQPDFKIKHLRERIESKCQVLYFPINFHNISNERTFRSDLHELHLVWPHRWEHDKNPQLLANVLIELNQRQIPFTISIVGEEFEVRPICFDEIKEKLAPKIRHFGFLSRYDYIKCLTEADVVISTADHEFYGVSM